MNRENVFAKTVYRIMDTTLLPLVKRLELSPDQITMAGLLLSLLAGGAFVLSPPGGALLLMLAGACDILDGHLARTNGRTSPAGAFLDSVLDRYGEIFVMAGSWGYLYRLDRLGAAVIMNTLLIFAAITGSLLVSYARARGEGLGVSCREGFFQRTARVLILIAAGLLEPLAAGKILPACTGLIAVGSHLTAIGRIRFIRGRLRQNRI